MEKYTSIEITDEKIASAEEQEQEQVIKNLVEVHKEAMLKEKVEGSTDG